MARSTEVCLLAQVSYISRKKCKDIFHLVLFKVIINTGWFNSKIRSRANLLICQQTNIKAQLKFFSDKVPDFRIEPTFSCWNLDKKLRYEKITLAGIGVGVNHETLISNSKKWQIGAENLLRGGRSIISRLIAVISSGALTQNRHSYINPILFG